LYFYTTSVTKGHFKCSIL